MFRVCWLDNHCKAVIQLWILAYSLIRNHGTTPLSRAVPWVQKKRTALVIQNRPNQIERHGKRYYPRTAFFIYRQGNIDMNYQCIIYVFLTHSNHVPWSITHDKVNLKWRKKKTRTALISVRWDWQSEKREKKLGFPRNDLGDKVFYGERHIADIENIGKHPSFQLFHDLVTMFHISVDEYFYPQEKAEKSTIRRQIDVSLDELTDEELKIIQGTIDGIMKYKGTGSK